MLRVMRAWKILGVAAGCMLTSHCGESDPAKTGSPADDARQATFRDVESFVGSLGDAPDRAKLVAYFQSRSEFEEAGESEDGSVYARFTDGRLLIVGGARPPATTPVEAPDPAPAAVTDPNLNLGEDLGPAARELPKVGVVRLFDSLGAGFADSMDRIAPQFTSFGYALATGAVQKGTLEEWKTLGNEGYFSVDAHGGTGKGRGAVERDAVWTSTLASAAADAANADDLADNHLVYFVAKNDGKLETHYAVTDLFVAKYVKLADRTVVFVNACHSAATPLAKSFTTANANLYLGWSNAVEDGDAAMTAFYVVDRALGRFKMPPAVKRRVPLTWNELYRDIYLDTNPKTGAPYSHSKSGADLKFSAGPGDVFVLPPAITAGRMSTATREIVLTGNFGTVPGTVWENPAEDGSGGTSIAVKSWTADTIVATGTAITPLVVAKVDTRRTNVFRIPGGEYRLYNNTDAKYQFRVRDRIVVYRSGEKVYEDPLDRVDGLHDPIKFVAMSGDTLKIEVYAAPGSSFGGMGPVVVRTPSRRYPPVVAQGALDLPPNATTGLALTRELPLWHAEPIE